MKFIKKEKQRIFLTGALVLLGFVIFGKYGGQSLLVHYLWPFIVLGSIILLFEKKWLKNRISWSHVLAILGLGAFLMSFIFDLSPSDGSLELVNITFGILLAIVLSNVKWKNSSYIYLFLGIILIVCVMDAWGLLAYASGHPFNRLAGPLMKPNEAFSGFPNLAANLNLIALLPAFYLMVNPKGKSRVMALGLILANVVIIASLLLTYSRAAWFAAFFVFGLSVVVLVIKYWKYKELIFKYVMSAALIIFLGISLFFSANYIRSYNESIINVGEKISFQSEDEGSSVSERVQSISRSIQMALDKPLTGVGSGSFNYISQSYEQNFSTLSSYPYSFPFKLLAENGIIAFVLIVLWIVVLIFYTLKKRDIFPFICGLTVLALLLHHSMDNNFNSFAASFPLFLLIGMMWGEPKKSLFKNFWVLLMIILLGLSGVLFVLHEGYYGTFYIKGRNAAGAQNHEEGYKYYSRASSMIFARDTNMAAALSAYELYKSLDQDKWLIEAQSKINEYAANDNPLDKRAHLLFAEINIDQQNYSDCLENVFTAYKLGGANEFKTDYFNLLCTKMLNKDLEYNALVEEIIPKLEVYFNQLKVNVHMTVLTDNPKYAVEILKLITTDDETYLRFYNKMRKTAILETQKFHDKYGIDAEVKF